MSRKLHALALGLTVAAAAVPATALAGEELLEPDPQAAVTVFHDDGTVTKADSAAGGRAFVDELVEEGASGSAVRADTYGAQRTLNRNGYSSPTTKRYVLYRKNLTRSQALARISERTFRNAEGRLVTERGWAVDIATGETKKVSLSAAKRLSADPRAGAPNTEYVFQVWERP